MGSEKRIVFDVDGVLAKKDDGPYADKDIDEEVFTELQEYRERGFEIVLYTARNMNSYDGRIGKINANTAGVLLDWLEEHDVPYDEIYYGKPWCGENGFYVDDKAIRPSEFIEMDHQELRELVEQEER